MPVLAPPLVPLPVPCDGERYGSVGDEPAPEGDDVLLGNELVPDVGALPPAPEPCTLEDVPPVGGQEQFAALSLGLPALACAPVAEPDVPLTPEDELEGLLALGDVEEVLALGVELDVAPALEGDVDEPLALDGELLLPLTAPAPMLELPPAPDVDAPGGQVQFSAPPALVPPVAALPVAFSEVPPAPVVALPVELLDGKLGELWLVCDWDC